MASQEEKVEGQQTETNAAEDTAKFSGAWDEFETKETGQPDQASGRQETDDEGADQGGDEAGQGEAEAGQPDASASPEADADKASRETSDDVWASADPKLREAHENALKAANEQARKAEHLARSNGGRLAKALTKLSALEGQLADKAGTDGKEATDEEIEAAKRDYPELVNPLLKQIESLRGTVDALSTTAKADAESDVASALQDEATALIERHPDTADIVKAPEYAAWLEAQPPGTKRIVQENSQQVVSAADVIKLFDDFKRETGFGKVDAAAAEAARIAAERRAEQLDAGRSVSGAQPGVRSDVKLGDGQYGDEWDKLEAQDRRKAAGRK